MVFDGYHARQTVQPCSNRRRESKNKYGRHIAPTLTLWVSRAVKPKRIGDTCCSRFEATRSAVTFPTNVSVALADSLRNLLGCTKRGEVYQRRMRTRKKYMSPPSIRSLGASSVPVELVCFRKIDAAKWSIACRPSAREGAQMYNSLPIRKDSYYRYLVWILRG